MATKELRTRAFEVAKQAEASGMWSTDVALQFIKEIAKQSDADAEQMICDFEEAVLESEGCLR